MLHKFVHSKGYTIPSMLQTSLSIFFSLIKINGLISFFIKYKNTKNAKYYFINKKRKETMVMISNLRCDLFLFLILLYYTKFAWILLYTILLSFECFNIFQLKRLNYIYVVTYHFYMYFRK